MGMKLDNELKAAIEELSCEPTYLGLKLISENLYHRRFHVASLPIWDWNTIRIIFSKITQRLRAYLYGIETRLNSGIGPNHHCCEPTYMGLKRGKYRNIGKKYRCCEPTYMGLKRGLIDPLRSHWQVASLPIWDWNIYFPFSATTQSLVASLPIWDWNMFPIQFLLQVLLVASLPIWDWNRLNFLIRLAIKLVASLPIWDWNVKFSHCPCAKPWLRAYLYGIETGRLISPHALGRELRAYLYGIET